MIRHKPKGLLHNIEWLLLLLFCILGLIGIAEQYSAAHGNLRPWAYKNILITSFFFPFFCIIVAIDNKKVKDFAYPLYLACVLSLLYLACFGSSIMGANRWLKFRYFNIQPSEMAKIAMILTLSKYFSMLNQHTINKYTALLFGILIALVPVLLIFLQPNFGTCAVNIFIAASIFFVAGVGLKKIAAITAVSFGCAPIIWNLLRDYQKKRVLSFLHPDKDPLGSSYNSIQSKIAIGSGGLWGKGFLQGSQTQLDFLPEKQTDFIFTIFLEEFGMIGGLVFLLLYILMLLRMLKIAMESADVFNRLTATGIGAMMFAHMALNISMAIGILPVVGVPLPLLSYGGSIFLNSLLSLALLLNINIQNKKHNVIK